MMKKRIELLNAVGHGITVETDVTGVDGECDVQVTLFNADGPHTYYMNRADAGLLGIFLMRASE